MTKTLQIAIPWKKILVPENNMRHSLDKVKELAAAMSDQGQHTPVIVSEGGTPEQPYILRAGFRRHAAFELNEWQNKEMLATVRTYPKDDPLAPFVDMWSENQDREDVSPVDLATFLDMLCKGNYITVDGTEVVPIDRATLCKRFHISNGYLSKLLKVARNLSTDTMKRARSAGAPTRLVVALSTIEGTGDTDEKREVDRDRQQDKMLENWITRQEELKAAGRQRETPKKNGKGKDEEVEPKPALAPTKLIGKKDSTFRRPVQDYARVLEAKKEAAAKTDKAFFDGAHQAFRFISGETKTLKGLNAEDFAFLDEVAAEEEVQPEAE